MLAAFATQDGAVFTEEALQGAGGAAWSHPAFTGRDRSIAIITVLAAQGVSGGRLGTHLQLCREHGLLEESLTALMTLLAGYAGYPRGSLATETVHGLVAATDQGAHQLPVVAVARPVVVEAQRLAEPP